jgi:hypothetical protein
VIRTINHGEAVMWKITTNHNSRLHIRAAAKAVQGATVAA